MRNSTTLLFLILVLATEATFAQTRARRAEQTPTAETPGQEELDVIRVDTNLVTIPVSVLDRNGRYIVDLQKEDFRVDEDGVEQRIAYFATVEKSVTVVLMIDTSTSTWSRLGQIKDAAKAFVEQLNAEDQVMVVSFARGLTIKCEPTADRRKIREAIDDTGKGLSTHLYDAINRIMQTHLKRIKGRKALVLFTDGVDATSNNATYESTVHAAEELDALIYSIRYDTYDPAADTGGASVPPQSNGRLPWILRKLPVSIGNIGGSSSGGAGSSKADYERGERYLQELARLTGGREYEANKDLSLLRDAFSHIAEELTRQYTLGYYPTKRDGSGERRRIKVHVNRADVAVRARDGYIYKG